MIILRCPEDTQGFKFEGWWFVSLEAARSTVFPGLKLDRDYQIVPSGRFEARRIDGKLCEVYEVRSISFEGSEG